MHIAKLISSSVLIGAFLVSNAAHADEKIQQAPPPKRGKPALIVTGTVLSVIGTGYCVGGIAGLAGNSGGSFVSTKLIGGIALGVGVAMLGVGVPLIVYGSTATRTPRAVVGVSANGFFLRGTF